MDEQIGRLRATLKELGVEDNTLIWFCSDNGAASNNKSFGEYGGYGSNRPFKGRTLPSNNRNELRRSGKS